MVLGIVGSPRKGRLIDQLVMRTLEGVQSTGIETRKVYLVNSKVPFYTEEATFRTGRKIRQKISSSI